MNRTKIQRLTALLLCLIFVVSSFSVNVFAADSTDGSADTSQSGGESVDNSALTFDTEEMLELLDAISYREYIKEHASVKKADGAIVIDAIKDVNAEKSDIDVATSVDTFEGVKAGTIFCALVNGWIIGRLDALYTRRFEFRDRFNLRAFFEQ
jgi:hypothetical protein